MGHRAGEEYWKVKDRDRFWEVIAQGGSLAAAAASVGVTRAAGLRWLRNGLIPEWCRQKIIDRVQPGTGPLTFVERGWIQEMCRVGFTTSEMARLLVDEGSITSTSVDLQPDFTYEIVVGADGEEQMVVTQAQVMGFTIANFGAIGEAEIWNLGGEDVVAVDDDEAEMLVASGFAVWTLDDGCYAQAEALQLAVTASADLPLAPREHEWDGDGAAQRVAEFCRNEAGDLDGACYGRAFFWRDTDAPAENVGSYRLGFADVIDGRLHAIPRGIFAVAGVLQGAMGGVDLPEADQDAIRTAVNGWYERMADEFDDDSIVPPWAAEMSPDDEGEGIDDTADPEVPEAEMAGVR